MTAAYGKTITEADVVLYADITGDVNPLHLDQEYASRTTVFEGRVAHGMLTAGLIAAAIGTKLPGPGTIYVDQTLRFKAPVRIGDTVVARVTVSKLISPGKRLVELKTVCTVGETTRGRGRGHGDGPVPRLIPPPGGHATAGCRAVPLLFPLDPHPGR